MKKRSAFLSALFIVSLFATLALGISQPAVNAAPRHPNLAALAQIAQAQGEVAVIVMLSGSFQPEASLADSAAVTQQQAALNQAQTGVLSRLAGSYDPATVKRFSFIPSMALHVNPAGLAALAADPAVLSILEDRLAAPDLSQSVALIGAPTVWASGYSGAGQAVVIIDTGVEKTHPFLAGRVVSEACYSSTNATYGSTAMCPGGVSSSIAANSAMPYAGTCPATLCDHGTHVAGIAAGRDPGGAGATGFSGVAKDASLIAIQVFSKFVGASCGGVGVTCVLSYASDQILALERVYALRNTYAIAAVNMSLGGGQYSNTQQALCDSDNAPTKLAIDNLRNVGIATVIASGNNGYTTAMGAPACISTAVSVGSVTDGTPGDTQTSTPDVVATTSNATTYLSLLAPGRTIYSSIPGAAYGNKTGTSMATPHVAGAWAVLKSKFPGASVTNVLNTLVATGKPITDTRTGANNLVKPRIRLDLAAIGAYSISGKITQVDATTPVAGVTVSTDSGLITTTTDASGNYTLSGLIEGSYTVTPSKTGVVFSPVSQAVSVGPSKININFTATLYSISGQVTLSAVGLAGVTVSAGAGHTAITNASGNYTITGLPPATYTVTPSLAEYTFTAPSQSVTVGPNQTGKNFTATRVTYTISGRVTLSGGFAVAGATLTTSPGGYNAISDASGNFTISGVPSNTYTVTPSKAGYTSFAPVNRSVAVGPSKTGIDFVGTTPLFSVSGKVTSDGTTGIAGVLIFDGLGRSTITAANGTYTLNGLPAGSYTLSPFKVPLLFTPKTQPAVIVAANLSGINFVGASGGFGIYLPIIKK